MARSGHTAKRSHVHSHHRVHPGEQPSCAWSGRPATRSAQPSGPVEAERAEVRERSIQNVATPSGKAKEIRAQVRACFSLASATSVRGPSPAAERSPRSTHAARSNEPGTRSLGPNGAIKEKWPRHNAPRQSGARRPPWPRKASTKLATATTVARDRSNDHETPNVPPQRS